MTLEEALAVTNIIDQCETHHIAWACCAALNEVCITHVFGVTRDDAGRWFTVAANTGKGAYVHES